MEWVIRFLVGGVVVSAFAMMGDVLQPKSFAGLFGAAPSIALATIVLTIHKEGKLYTAQEASSMMLGAIAFIAYAAAASFVLRQRRFNTLKTTIALMPVWFGVSFGLWAIVARFFG
jgi:hypothetical protein